MKLKESTFIFFVICLVIVILYCGLFILTLNEEYTFDLELEGINSSIIYPQESKNIRCFLAGQNNISDNCEKLRLISNYTQKDFIWFLGNKSFRNYDIFHSPFSYFTSLNPNLFGHYISDNSGNRVIRAGKFVYNPYFISYYKAGACGEHASLALHLANETGLKARKVSDISGYHAWLEVYHNDEWYFYDPTFNTSEYEISHWFNERKFRWNSSTIKDAGRIFHEKEDITHEYPPYGTLNISGISSSDELTLSWTGGDTTYRYNLNTDSNNISVNLTPKKYDLTVRKYFILGNKTEVIIRPDETQNIDLRHECEKLSFILRFIHAPVSLCQFIISIL